MTNGTNLTISNSTMAPESVYPKPGKVEFSFRLLQSVLIVLLNAFILLVFYRMKKFSFSNVLFIALAISDLLVGLQVPFTLVYETLLYWPFGEFWCMFYNIWSYAQLRTSNQLTVVMSLHRFIALVRPFSAQEQFNLRQFLAILFAWVIPYAYITTLVLVFYFQGRFNLQYCILSVPNIIVGLETIIIDLVPSLFAVIINIYNIHALYRKYKRSMSYRTVHRPSKSLPIRATVAIAPNFQQQSSVQKTSASELKIRNTRRDLKAAVCILAIILNILVSEFPLYILYLSVAYFPSLLTISLFVVTLKMIYLFPLFNPLILMAFSSSVKKETCSIIKKVFCKWC